MAVEIILENTKMACAVCNNTMILPQITEEDLPFKFYCPNQDCGQEYNWGSLPTLPKVDPASARSLTARKVIPVQEKLPTDERFASDDFLANQLQISGEDSLLPKPIGQLAPSDRIITKPFVEHAASIEAGMRGTLKSIDCMKQDLETLAANLREQFTMESDYAKRAAFNWNREELLKFVQHPFVAMEATTDDPRIAPYCKYVFSPGFYHPHLGFPLYAHGSFYFELVCPYSRLSFPISNIVCGRLGVPNNLALEVYGGKIVGRSLKFCYDDIDGMTYDDDHNNTDPSIKIQDRLAAYRWLVDHGVNPWRPNPLWQANQKMMRKTDGIIDLIKARQNYFHAFTKFNEWGRLLILWSDIGESREFAVLMSHLFKQTKAIIVYDEKTIDDWKNVTLVNIDFVSPKETVYATYKDVSQIQLELLNQIPMLVIDYQSGVSMDFMQKLVHYTGRLIVVGSGDIAADVLEDSKEISILSAITGTIVVDNLEIHGESWMDAKMAKQNSIWRSITKLREKRKKQQHVPAEFRQDHLVSNSDIKANGIKTIANALKTKTV